MLAAIAVRKYAYLTKEQEPWSRPPGSFHGVIRIVREKRLTYNVNPASSQIRISQQPQICA